MAAAPPIAELNDRARDIFRRVVDGYLASGVPVGSRTLAAAGLNLSPASIRSVLAQLEEAGLLAAPHTSAGRMPTERGLRLFVDGMMQALEPTREEQAAIAARAGAGGPVEEALAATTAALSGLSACAGLVMVPKREQQRLRSIGFVPLSRGQALAVLVAEDGAVENRVIDLAADISPSALIEAGNYMSATLGGLTLAEARAQIERELAAGRTAIDDAARDLVRRGIALWSDDGRRPVLIVRGQGRLLDEAAADDLDRVRELLDDLDGKQEVATLLDSARAGDATRIFIGAETKLFALSGSAVIAKPFRGLDGRVVGVVGVIGPTRLNYARVVPMVDFTAATLARLMG